MLNSHSDSEEESETRSTPSDSDPSSELAECSSHPSKFSSQPFNSASSLPSGYEYMTYCKFSYDGSVTDVSFLERAVDGIFLVTRLSIDLRKMRGNTLVMGLFFIYLSYRKQVIVSTNF